MNSSKRKFPFSGSKKKTYDGFNIQKFLIMIILSITLGLSWGIGFFATSHDILPVVITFQAIFTVVVGIHGVLLFILHGIRNPDARALWKKMFLTISRKKGKILGSAQSTGTKYEMKSTKQVSIPTSPSTDLGLSHSYDNDCLAIKIPQQTKLLAGTATATNNNDNLIIDNKASNVKYYRSEKEDVLIQGHEGFVSAMIKKI